MNIYINVLVKWGSLILSMAAFLGVAFLFLKWPNCCLYVNSNICRDLYSMHLTFLQLIMVVVTAILGVVSIAIPFMTYNWNKDRQKYFEVLKKEIKDDYRQMKEDMRKEREDMQKDKDEIKEDRQYIKENIGKYSYSFIIERLIDGAELKKYIEDRDYLYLKDVTIDKLKKNFKDGTFSELCINHLIALVKNSNIENKNSILARLKKIRAQEHDIST